MRRFVLAAVVAGIFGAVAAGPAMAENDSVGIFHTNADWQLINRLAKGSTTDYSFALGAPGDLPVAGDWNGDGKDGVGVYHPNGINGSSWYLLNGLPPSGGTPSADVTVTNFGNAGDKPFAGDFNGDGKDDIGIYRGSDNSTSDWYIHLSPLNGQSAPLADIVLSDFGDAGDQPVTGDWDNDGKDGIGIFRPSTHNWYFVNNIEAGGSAPLANPTVTNYGNPGDLAVAGDWDGDGRDGVGLYRGSAAGAWYLTHRVDTSPNAPLAHIVFDYWGLNTDRPIVGDWDGKKPECRDAVDNDRDSATDTADAGCDQGEYDSPEVDPAGPAALWTADAERPMDQEWASVCVEDGNPFGWRTNDTTALATEVTPSLASFVGQETASPAPAQGLKSYRLTIHDGDNCGTTDGSSERAELAQSNPGRTDMQDRLFNVGDERWISWQVYFPSTFPVGATTWQSILQWKQVGGLGTPALNMDAAFGKFRLFSSGTNTDGNGAGFSRWEAPAVTGRWVKFTLHVKFSPDPAVGFVELYSDVASAGNVVRVLAPTPTHTMKWPNDSSAPQSHARIGPYRDQAINGTASAYYDGYSVATNRAAAEYNAFRR